MLMTAVNICYGADEQRSFMRFNAQDLVLSVGLELFGVVAVALVAVLPAALTLLPVPSTFHNVIALARWPFLAVLAMLALAIIYRYAPDRPNHDGN
jgi:membrane protein